MTKNTNKAMRDLYSSNATFLVVLAPIWLLFNIAWAAGNCKLDMEVFLLAWERGFA